MVVTTCYYAFFYNSAGGLSLRNPGIQVFVGHCRRLNHGSEPRHGSEKYEAIFTNPWILRVWYNQYGDPASSNYIVITGGQGPTNL